MLTAAQGEEQLMAVTDEQRAHRFYTGSRADLNPDDRFYHGTRADLKPGDLIKPGHPANFGKLDRFTTYVYFSATLDAGIWGAELARGEGRGRIYVVEPTGPFTDDPNLTDKKFPGNPTKSYRSREPLCVVAECTDWQGHAPQVLQAMKDHLERLKQQGVQPIDD
jgi:Rifampin ADP-ribosyl transferase